MADISYLIRVHNIDFSEFYDYKRRPASLKAAIEMATKYSKDDDIGSCGIHETTNVQIKTFVDGKDVPLGSDN